MLEHLLEAQLLCVLALIQPDLQSVVYNISALCKPFAFPSVSIVLKRFDVINILFYCGVQTKLHLHQKYQSQKQYSQFGINAVSINGLSSRSQTRTRSKIK